MIEIEWFMALTSIEKEMVMLGSLFLLTFIILICSLIYKDKKEDKKTVQKKLEEKYGKMS